ncbi:TonB-dependent siderophore receptor [Neisseria leonii]|uniref:TonB-dependent siderophore receptor n=1 Tax=Neisseria leonii TaxID=2995413 RepID=UPI00237A37EF|nr:TonB-dependent siderophore receptor [Neisseria sp. 3986]MDD9325264.1 TonB-dependent siderophore receptor [Neisseria sp. 3986]
MKPACFKYSLLYSALLAGLAHAADTVELDTVQVEGTRNAARYSYIPEGGRSATATKTDRPLSQTPNTVSVVTRRHLDEREPFDLPTTLAYTSGINRSGYRSENSWIEASIRGVSGTMGGGYGAPSYGGTEPTYINGSRYFAHLEFNPYLLQSIDIAKGPNAVLYGQSNPGGIINMNLKAPTGSNEHEIIVKTGTGKRKEIDFDIDRSLNDNLDYRIVGAAKQVEWRVGKNGKQQSYSLAPSLKWRNDRTELKLDLLYENQPNAGERNFLPRKGTIDAYSDGTRIPRDFFAGDPGFHKESNRKLRLGYDLTHTVSDKLTLSQHAAYGRYGSYMKVLASLEGGPWTRFTRPKAVQQGILGSGEKDIYRESTTWDYNWREFQIDNRARLTFDTGRLNHTLLAGLDYYNGRQSLQKWENTPQYGINSANPVYGVPILPFPQTADQTGRIRQTGLYLHDQMQAGNLHLQIGGRYDMARTAQSDPFSNGSSQSLKNNRFTWRTGALYQLPYGISPYASYSTTFIPATGFDNNGRALQPVTAAQKEIGIKYQPADNFMLTASLFDIRQKNLSATVRSLRTRQPDGKWTSGIVQDGQARSRGFELEWQGDITPAWGISGSYTYLRQTIERDPAGTSQGNTHWGLPAHSGALWTDYRVQRGALRGLSAGIGYRYTGTTWGNSLNTFKVPAYGLWDLKLAYKPGERFAALRGSTVQLNIQNLADKKYVASCAEEFACFYGTGRRATLSFGYRW